MTFDLRTERSARKFLNGGNRLRLKIFAVKPLYRIAAFRGDSKISYPYSVNTPIQYVTLHFRDRCGAALLRYRNRAPQQFLCVFRSPIQYGFRSAT